MTIDDGRGQFGVFLDKDGQGQSPGRPECDRRLYRRFMGDGIDAFGKAADNGDADASELAAKLSSNSVPIGAWTAGADNG